MAKWDSSATGKVLSCIVYTAELWMPFNPDLNMQICGLCSKSYMYSNKFMVSVGCCNTCNGILQGFAGYLIS